MLQPGKSRAEGVTSNRRSMPGSTLPTTDNRPRDLTRASASCYNAAIRFPLHICTLQFEQSLLRAGMVTFYSSSRPTLSTASYTVRSTKPPSTLAARIFFQVTVATRIICGVFLLWLLVCKWRSDQTLRVCDGAVAKSICSMRQNAQRTPWLSLLPMCTIGLWIAVRRGYIEENLLVLRGMGLQTSTSSWAYLLPPSTRFIPTTSVQDTFIYEAFKGFEVRYYLAVIVEGEEDVHVVFPVSCSEHCECDETLTIKTLLPERKILEDVWRGSRSCLYESKG